MEAAELEAMALALKYQARRLDAIAEDVRQAEPAAT
jgi:hypothetical protein